MMTSRKTLPPPTFKSPPTSCTKGKPYNTPRLGRKASTPHLYRHRNHSLLHLSAHVFFISPEPDTIPSFYPFDFGFDMHFLTFGFVPPILKVFVFHLWRSLDVRNIGSLASLTTCILLGNIIRSPSPGLPSSVYFVASTNCPSNRISMLVSGLHTPCGYVGTSSPLLTTPLCTTARVQRLHNADYRAMVLASGEQAISVR